MRKDPTHARLSKRDLELILSVVDCAWRNDWAVANVVRHRLTQNEVALSMCRDPDDTDEQEPEAQEARDAEYRQVAAETRRILRLQRRFASWRAADFAEPCSDTPRPASRQHDHAAKG